MRRVGDVQATDGVVASQAIRRTVNNTVDDLNRCELFRM